MRKGTLQVAIAATLLALAAPSVKAETPVLGPRNNTLELRVVNNHASPMRVFLKDATGKLHRLGTVACGDFRIIEVPGEVMELGAVQLKLVPNEPVWSLRGGVDGIRTRDLDLRVGDAVNFWVETDLTDSTVEILKA